MSNILINFLLKTQDFMWIRRFRFFSRSKAQRITIRNLFKFYQIKLKFVFYDKALNRVIDKVIKQIRKAINFYKLV